jgi:hypothetical protein
MTNPVIERDDTDPVYVDAATDGRIELRIGKPIQQRFQPPPSGLGGSSWAIPKLLERGSSLVVLLTPAEARVVAHSLLAAAERASS